MEKINWNVAQYIRVSTEKQEALNQQLHFIDIISGKEDKRPEWDKMFSEARKKKFDILLFWDLSRFSRSGTLFTLQRLDELEKLGIRWISYQEPYLDSLGPFKDVVISIFSSINKVEREKISERTKAGLERALEQGKTLG
jgi:putative DNA-invertase from lambdoid prophage Rac